MKTKKTSLIVTLIVVAVSLLALGLSFLLMGINGNLKEFFSKEEFNIILNSLCFQGGKFGVVLGVAMYVGLLFVVVMFVLALCKKRGWFTLLDLLALALGCGASMNLVYWVKLNRNSITSLIFAIALAVLCLFTAVLPLLCVASEAEDHPATTLAPLPSSIPTVEKKTASEETQDEAKNEETADSQEAPADEKSVEETKPEPVIVNNAPTTKESPSEEKPVEAETESSSKKEPAETSSESLKDDKIAKTEEKPMKEEKKTTKTAAPKTAPKTAPKAAAAPKAQKAQGKYEVYPEAGFFKYRLKANNGEILIVSNGYKTRDGAHKGIDTLVKAVAGGVAKIVIDKNKYAQFRLYTASDSRLIVAGEYYPNTKGAQSALESVEKFYKTDKVVDLDEIPESEVREWRISLGKAENSGKGKFEIYIDETNKYRGRLLANNGQLLFATSAYAAKNGVNGALEKVQKKFNSTDVTVTCDKQGRYQFIVYADNGSVLVMGESYKSKDRAISAAQSSKNFASNPQIFDVTKADD